MLLVSIQISYYSNSSLKFRPLEFHFSHPWIKNLIIREIDKVVWEYIPTTSPTWEYESTSYLQAPLRNLRCGTKTSQTTLQSKVMPLNSTKWAKRLQGTSWESKMMAITRVENRGKSGDTTHPTQLNPRRHHSSDGKIVSIHGSQCSSLGTHNNEA